MMYYVGIDVAKDKHDCCIIDSSGTIIVESLCIKNSLECFTRLVQRINSLTPNRDEIEIGLEDTGHYSNNLVGFFSNLYTVKTINPLLTAKHKKAETLRRTKTDKIDAIEIAKMLRIGTGFRPVVSIPYNHKELKSLSRYRMSLIRKRSVERISIKRLISILIPEYESVFKNVHSAASYAVLLAHPNKTSLSNFHVPALTKLLWSTSRGHYGEDMAIKLREIAGKSIGDTSGAKSYELTRTIKRAQSLAKEIAEVEHKIEELLRISNPPIATIPGISITAAASIIGEIGDFSKFSNPNKILAMAGLSPTTYQSGKYTGGHGKMEKRGSRYLRNTLFLAARAVSIYSPEFGQYLLKKQMEGKHYFVALSHVAKKLVRLMYALETSHRPYEIKSITE